MHLSHFMAVFPRKTMTAAVSSEEGIFYLLKKFLSSGRKKIIIHMILVLRSSTFNKNPPTHSQPCPKSNDEMSNICSLLLYISIKSHTTTSRAHTF